MDSIHQAFAYTQIAFWKLLYGVFRITDSSPTRQCNDDSITLTEHYNMFMSDATNIINYGCANLFVGSAKNAADWTFLRENDVKAVVNVTEEIPNFYPAHLTYHTLSVRDIENASLAVSEIAAAVAFIDQHMQAGNSVLVHCFMGRSRSVAIACAYIVSHMHTSPADAYAQIKEKRSHVNINTVFYEAIQTYAT